MRHQQTGNETAAGSNLRASPLLTRAQKKKKKRSFISFKFQTHEQLAKPTESTMVSHTNSTKIVWVTGHQQRPRRPSSPHLLHGQGVMPGPCSRCMLPNLHRPGSPSASLKLAS
ncbi:hypothetical protein SORBI_3002G223550 [Sorghum bicolor]|uniref:Uncharacterized protein n=1 Tax=Sorghum bicolor TaxID=4558 RepID=A0A1W0W5C4_SORBI|nr:hypothetical protein SORBI_3002G223550 [Sorghum bicolor]